MTYKCCVRDCEEAVRETRSKGLPLHKFPKDPLLRIRWLTSGGFEPDFKPTNSQIVCYKHFRLADYEIGRSHKLFLKKGSVPTVFTDYENHPDPIGPESEFVTSRLQAREIQKLANAMAPALPPVAAPIAAPSLPPVAVAFNPPFDTTASSGLDLDSSGNCFDTSCSSLDQSLDSSYVLPGLLQMDDNGGGILNETDCDMTANSASPAAVVVDASLGNVSAILNVPGAAAEAIAQPGALVNDIDGGSHLASKVLPMPGVEHSSTIPKPNSGPLERPNIMFRRGDLDFIPGSKLEAKDFNDMWYSARIVETDWLEREVLIHFDNWSSRYDEWIGMNSSRLRTIQSNPSKPKNKEFLVGDRVLATWVDGRKYPATVKNVAENDRYNVLFDDGYEKILRPSKMTKMKEVSENALLGQPRPYPQGMTHHTLGSKQERREKKRKHTVSELFHHSKKKSKMENGRPPPGYTYIPIPDPATSMMQSHPFAVINPNQHPGLPDGTLDADYATFIGNLRVEMEDSSFKCPKAGCNKNFRNEHLLQMHIKHYHPEYSKLLGSLPKVADLAYARTTGESIEDLLPRKPRTNLHPSQSTNSISQPMTPATDTDPNLSECENRYEHRVTGDSFSAPEDNSSEQSNSYSMSPGTLFDMRIKEERTRTGIKTLPPVRHSIASEVVSNEQLEFSNDSHRSAPVSHEKSKSHRRRQSHHDSSKSRRHRGTSEHDSTYDHFDDSSLNDENVPDSFYNNLSGSTAVVDNDYNTRTPRNDVILENGVLIKVEKLKREEIINCTCGITEEDGLMIQCDLCLCWQHGHCNAIEREKDVPEKYVCYICQHSYRQRPSKKYYHNQDWVREGTLPSIHSHTYEKMKYKERTAMLKRSYDLIAGLLEIQDLLHSLRVKVNVVQHKDHPKLYLWAKNWSEVNIPTFKLEPVPVIEVIKDEQSTDTRTNGVTVEKLELPFPIKSDPDQKLITSDTELMKILEEDTPPTEETNPPSNPGVDNCPKDDGENLLNALTKNGFDDNQLMPQNDQQMPLMNGNGHVDSPAGQDSVVNENSNGLLPALRIPIAQPIIPEPEAPIDPVECKLRLLKHIDHFQNYVDSTLNFVETQLSALEDMTFKEGKDDNQHLKSKHTIKMLLRDLETMRKIAALC
ncbi:hypothetical protein QAD02_006387 [Eretmocerus hayati]|uniref:Uncharacterized protein n=1 Tax=Eretmocerus hayati TaxID=131215 RepID=A0ACC2N4X2_9HYME|nr:hypothetical protein QAD02_006387 [Eretmocerus hayati]